MEIDDNSKKYHFELPKLPLDAIWDKENSNEPILLHEDYGSLFVNLANINSSILSEIVNREYKFFIDESINEMQLISNLNSILKKQFCNLPNVLHIIMILDIKERLCPVTTMLSAYEEALKRRKEEGMVNVPNSYKIDFDKRLMDLKLEIQELIALDIIEACIFCRNACDALIRNRKIYLDDNNINLWSNIKLSEDNIITMSYMIYTLKEISYLDYFKVSSQHIPIKKCENCGKYFIPKVRSDEKYCNNIFKDGKTCKQLGYEIKLKNNEFKAAYRSAYKTQRARIAYNRHIENYEELHFKPWEKAAKQTLADFSSKKDIDGFQKWLKDNKDSF